MKQINITSISKWKRILVHLADLFLTFLFGIVLASTAIFPIGEQIIHFNDKNNEITVCNREKLDVLYGNNLLFYENENNKYDFNKSFSYTFDLYLENYVVSNNSKEIFVNYYSSILGDNSKLITLYSLFDENNDFFDITDSVSLKNEYKTLFAPYFVDGDNLSDIGASKLDQFKNRIFSQFYSKMISDIEENDLSFNEKSYKEILNLEQYNTNYLNNFFVIGSIISYILGYLIYFVAIPCFFANRRTIGMVMLKVQELDKTTLDIKNRKMLALSSLINIPENMSLMFLYPMLTIGIEKTVSLPYLIPLAVVGLLYEIVSLIVLLFNEFDRSLTEIVANSVIITDDDYDTIVYERNIKHE